MYIYSKHIQIRLYQEQIIFEDYFTKIKLNNFDQIFKIMLNKYYFYKNVIV